MPANRSLHPPQRRRNVRLFIVEQRSGVLFDQRQRGLPDPRQNKAHEAGQGSSVCESRVSVPRQERARHGALYDMPLSCPALGRPDPTADHNPQRGGDYSMKTSKKVGCVASVVDALRAAADEHGRPNRFHVKELHGHYKAPPPTLLRHVGRHLISRLWEELGGREKWGTCPRYVRESFYV